jgi:DnaJ-class molecular chaperone
MDIPVGCKECPDCYGSGEVEIEITCQMCGGSGMRNGDICCGGVDTKEVECENCDGLGYVEDENYEPPKP